MKMSEWRGLHRIIVVIVWITLLKQTSVSALCGRCSEDGFECQSDYFPCYRDCCLRGDAFCDDKGEKCVLCQEKQHLCGNDSMPVECMFYCDRVKKQPSSSDICLSQNTVIGISLLMAAVILGAIIISCTLAVLFPRVPRVVGKFFSRWCKKSGTAVKNVKKTNPKAQVPYPDANRKDVELKKRLLPETANPFPSRPAGCQVVDTDALHINTMENIEDEPDQTSNPTPATTPPSIAESPSDTHPTDDNNSKPEPAAYPSCYRSIVHPNRGGPVHAAHATSGASAEGRTSAPNVVKNGILDSPVHPARDQQSTERQIFKEVIPSSDDPSDQQSKKPIAIGTEDPTIAFRPTSRPT